MNQTEQVLGFLYIREELKKLANTQEARAQIDELKPYLKENELRKNMRETTQARKMLDTIGTPPIPAMTGMAEIMNKAAVGNLLLAEDMEQVGSFLAAVRRLQDYLGRGKQHQIGLAYYSENLVSLEELEAEIRRSIRNGKVDEYASQLLHTIRKKMQQLEEKIKIKADTILKANKSAMSDQFVVNRNGHICLPVKRDYKAKISGSVVDQSATGTTLFIEPSAVAVLTSELEQLHIEEDSEERRILYTLMDQIAEQEQVFRSNMELIAKLDFIFAKGRLSAEQNAVEPELHMERFIKIKQGRHPQLAKENCVPLDFQIAEGTRGVIITGPNTGGKTVAIKTIGLFGQMAGAGLHVPCKEASICMFNQILCDIGDGQNITDNLSTFSAHIKNVIHILEQTSEESLVILDELGSGTDPLEGMGIAIAILETLRQSGCMYLVTTHYPEVKEYANRYPEIQNARMAFDREQLKPLYRLELGSAGESCALYIAKKLGLSTNMLQIAAKEAYGKDSDALMRELGIMAENKEKSKKSTNEKNEKKESGEKTVNTMQGDCDTFIPKIIQETQKKPGLNTSLLFSRGDSVIVYPEEKIGIVVKPTNEQGEVVVQIQNQKCTVNQKRLKLKVAAAELYPEDYDFSIIFDSVENRKARHKLGKKYQGDLMVEAQSWK